MHQLLLFGKKSFVGFQGWLHLGGFNCQRRLSWRRISSVQRGEYHAVIVEYSWLLRLSTEQHIEFIRAFDRQPIIVVFDGKQDIDREALIAIGIQAVWSVAELTQVDLAALISNESRRHQRIRHMDIAVNEFDAQVTKLLDRQWVEQTALMLKKVRAQNEQLQHLACHDGLTGLMTREFFNQMLGSALAQAKRHDKSFALMMLDVDHFKEINDTFGHLAGDRILQEMSSCLKQQLRSEDVIARLGGDEFAIFLADISHATMAGRVAKKILDAISELSVMIDGHEVLIKISIGIACYPQAGQSTHDLMKHADTALYQAKERGRNRFQYFSDHLNQSLKEQLVMEKRLWQAFDQGGIGVEYLPLQSQSEVVDAMAWARTYWQTDDLGKIADNELSAIIRASSRASQFDFFLLQCVIRKLSQQANSSLVIVFPVSYMLFSHASFYSILSDTLSEYEVYGKQLMFVISGEPWLRDAFLQGQLLRDVTSLGCSFCWQCVKELPQNLNQLVKLPLRAIAVNFELFDKGGSKSLLRVISTELSCQLLGLMGQKPSAYGDSCDQLDAWVCSV